jgi:hypothetical protein
MTKNQHYTNLLSVRKFGSATPLPLDKKAKLAPNWVGPYEIVDVNDTKTKLKIKKQAKSCQHCLLKTVRQFTLFSE